MTGAGKSPFSRLIYPMPNEAGLGTHLTVGLDGEAMFGPDVEYVKEIEYSVEPSRGDTFYEAIRDYWPDLPDNALKPSYSGIRPKVILFTNVAYLVHSCEACSINGTCLL